MFRWIFFIVFTLVGISTTFKVFKNHQEEGEEEEVYDRNVRAPFNGMRGKKEDLEGELQREVMIIYITACSKAAKLCIVVNSIVEADADEESSIHRDEGKEGSL